MNLLIYLTNVMERKELYVCMYVYVDMWACALFVFVCFKTGFFKVSLAQADLELRDILASDSQVLGLEVCTTTQGM